MPSLPLPKAGYTVELPTDKRSYRGRIAELETVEIAFLSASEIARELIAGTIALGVTGEDLREKRLPMLTSISTSRQGLGFGGADVVVAVPTSWIDVETMADLDDVAAEFRQRHHRQLRIATKYWQLTQNWFADHGIAMYRIVESLGATEGAPAAGTADIIVDITSTGSTLTANHLKILSDGIILKSEANLIASRKAKLSKEDRAQMKEICAALVKSLVSSKS